jgi:xanthine dehydrogenase accessory factor
MRDVIPAIDRWLAEGQRVALATVVQTWGSSPRPVGAKMAISADGNMAGSVSGGCVEGAVVEAARQVLDENQPRLLHFGVADETAWEVGLACGGTVEVFVRPLNAQHYEPLREHLLAERTFISATRMNGGSDVVGHVLGRNAAGETFGDQDDPALQTALAEAQVWIDRGASARHSLALQDEPQAADLFIDVLLPPASLVMIGGVHIAVALTAMARALGYRSVVVDPRRAFANPERLPDADLILNTWPDQAFDDLDLNENSAVAALTHDPKIDDPALQRALKSPAFYIGALGSNKTQARRRARLLAAGLSEQDLARLHGPIGLDLGGRSPAEIALAILAEVVAVRNRSPLISG